MNKNAYSISKTSFLKLEQCHKAFFLYKNHPYLRDKVSVDKQLTFKRGHDVGYFAQQLFPGGIDVSKETKNSIEGVELTKKFIENKTSVIYEATFVFNGILIMVDILLLNENGYTAYEVKSSLKVSEIYLKDAYLQYYVLKNSLPNFEDLFLVTLNPDYILEGNIEPKKLFKRRSVKQKAEENFGYFNHRIAAAYELLDQNTIPNISVGKQCFRPYQCDFFGTCWKDKISENSIFNLPLFDRNKLFDWFENGVQNIEQIDDALIEKQNQIKIKKAFLSGDPIIDFDGIKAVLSKVKTPAMAMDMEIWNPAIPQIQGTKAFEQVPFLVCFYNGEIYDHFFSDNKPDGRKEFAEKLIDLSKAYATLLVYDKTMEVGVINALSNNFPEYKNELDMVKEKFVDLFDIFLNLHYYDPRLKSNFSLKPVSSLLLDDVAYTKINSGLEAMNFYDQYRLTENEVEKEELKTELVDYCNTDCLATFRLMEFLKSVVK